MLGFYCFDFRFSDLFYVVQNCCYSHDFKLGLLDIILHRVKLTILSVDLVCGSINVNTNHVITTTVDIEELQYSPTFPHATL